MHEFSALAFRPARPSDQTTHNYYDHSSAQRINTDTVLVESLRLQYPQLKLTTIQSTPCNLLSYAAATGLAKVTPITDKEDVLTQPLSSVSFVPPSRRMDGAEGTVVEKLQYGKFMYSWRGHDFLLYIASGRDGSMASPQVLLQYLLGSPEWSVSTLVRDCGAWALALHNEIWVFDGGMWQKDAALVCCFMPRDTYSHCKLPS
jgi:transitional endoplasmic reticulum ATPase